jgi:acyl-CoA thioester hydrolase
VVYEIGVFESGDESPKAVGEFIHVFVERLTMKPHINGMSEELRHGLEKITSSVANANL